MHAQLLSPYLFRAGCCLRGLSGAMLYFAGLMAAAAADTTTVPPFFVPGLRISFEAGSSTLAGTHWVQDDENGWVKFPDGHYYRPEESHQSGGVGILQINLLAVSPGFVAADGENYLNVDLARGTVISSGAVGLTGTAEALGEYWMNPTRLAQMRPGRTDGMEISRGGYALNGRQYKVVSIRRSGSGGYSIHRYDTETGLLVAGGSADVDPSVLVAGANGNGQVNVRGNANFSHTRLIGTRQTNIPWGKAAVPPMFGRGQRFDYQGGEQITMPQMPGYPQLPPLPPRAVSLSVAITDTVGPCVMTTIMQRSDLGPGIPPNESSGNRTFGSAMFNGLWMAPSALARMQPNQVLDEDPVTRFRTIYAGAQGGRVAVVEVGPRDQIERWYDAQSGLLTGFRITRQQENIGLVTTTYQLAGRPMTR